MQTNNIKIYDMTLRDGLQSLKAYPLETKIECINEIFKNNFYYVDYGTVTKDNSIKQMYNSDEILEYIKINFPNTNTIYGILIPNINSLNYDIVNKNNAFSLLCTIDDTYSYKNFNKSAKDNFNDVIKMLHFIIKFNYSLKKIRIYIACAFNKCKNNCIDLYNYTSEIISIIKKYNLNSEIIDIVFADTYNDINKEVLFDILSIFTPDKKKYIGLHLHCGNDFSEIIDICIKMKIDKIDSGLCNIGSCNFIKHKPTNYISTIELVKHLNNSLDLEILKNTENNLINILKL